MNSVLDYLLSGQWLPQQWSYYCIAALIGAALGSAEIATFHRSALIAALWSLPNLIYAGLNAAVSIIALALLAFAAGKTNDLTVLNGIGCGIGGKAILRTSLGKIKTGDRETHVSLASTIDKIMDMLSKKIDDKVLNNQIERIRRIPHFNKITFPGMLRIVEFWLKLVNIEEDTAKLIRKNIDKISIIDVDEKPLLIARLLVENSSFQTLKTALRSEIERIATEPLAVSEDAILRAALKPD